MALNLKYINTLLTTSFQFKIKKTFSELKPQSHISNPFKHQRFQSRVINYFQEKLHPRYLAGF